MSKDIFENGVWRTIGGRRIFIKDGEDLASAMKKSGKFKNSKKGKKEDEEDKEPKETSKSKDRVAVYDYSGYNPDATADPKYVDWAIVHATDEKDKEFWLKQKEQLKEAKPTYYIYRNKEPYKKAFEEYKKKHPNSKITLNEFINMAEGK